MKIRKAEIADAEGIARVHVDSWRTTYKGIMPDEYLANLSYEKRGRMWKNILSAETNETFSNFIMYVAENEDKEIIGFVSGGEKVKDDHGYKGELSGIYLLKEYQKQGIGRKLLSIFAENLYASGVESVNLWVLSQNNSRLFYEKMGAEKVLEKEISIGAKTLIDTLYGWKNISICIIES